MLEWFSNSIFSKTVRLNFDFFCTIRGVFAKATNDVKIAQTKVGPRGGGGSVSFPVKNLEKSLPRLSRIIPDYRRSHGHNGLARDNLVRSYENCLM